MFSSDRECEQERGQGFRERVQFAGSAKERLVGRRGFVFWGKITGSILVSGCQNGRAFLVSVKIVPGFGMFLRLGFVGL